MPQKNHEALKPEPRSGSRLRELISTTKPEQPNPREPAPLPFTTIYLRCVVGSMLHSRNPFTRQPARRASVKFMGDFGMDSRSAIRDTHRDRSLPRGIHRTCTWLRSAYRSVRLIFVVLLSTIFPGIPDMMKVEMWGIVSKDDKFAIGGSFFFYLSVVSFEGSFNSPNRIHRGERNSVSLSAMGETNCRSWRDQWRPKWFI